ncbi:MAG: hypothetical protein RJA70_4666 [Pseudomonadota bacterium]
MGAVDNELNTSERLAWERRLLARIRLGESAAAGELYDAYAQLLFGRVLLPRLGNHTAAEDVLSETFRTALERIAQFELRASSIYFWLARIAINKATDLHRAKRVSGRALVNLEGQLSVLIEGPLQPDSALECKKQYERVAMRLAECLALLNPRYRRAIELRFFEELSREECARELDVKLGTFDVLVLRSLKSLRKAWDEAQAEGKEPISGRLE